VKGKAVEDSQDARQEVLLLAYRVTGKPEIEQWSAGRGHKSASRRCGWMRVDPIGARPAETWCLADFSLLIVTQ
jgi:hypothetical protein